MIELNDESLKRYVDMVKSKDESVVSLLCTILEYNFHVKYAALYFYLYYYSNNKNLILNADYPKLSAFFRKSINGGLTLLTYHDLLKSSVDSYNTCKYNQENIFTEEAQFMINKIIKELIEYRLNTTRKQGKITIDMNITLKQNE